MTNTQPTPQPGDVWVNGGDEHTVVEALSIHEIRQSLRNEDSWEIVDLTAEWNGYGDRLKASFTEPGAYYTLVWRDGKRWDGV